MMRRHLLTLFALFTGLAAIHAPANASALETMVFDARAFARANDSGQAKACVCAKQNEKRPARCTKAKPHALPARLRDVLNPPVIFGSERALE